jgi:hypothetical protein
MRYSAVQIATNRSSVQSLLDLLEAVRGLTGLTREVQEQLLVAVEALTATRRPRPVDVDLAQHAGPLAEQLWQHLGRRKALILRTRLSQLAEAEDGHRQSNGRGRDLVARGGNGHAAHDQPTL